MDLSRKYHFYERCTDIPYDDFDGITWEDLQERVNNFVKEIVPSTAEESNVRLSPIDSSWASPGIEVTVTYSIPYTDEEMTKYEQKLKMAAAKRKQDKERKHEQERQKFLELKQEYEKLKAKFEDE